MNVAHMYTPRSLLGATSWTNQVQLYEYVIDHRKYLSVIIENEELQTIADDNEVFNLDDMVYTIIFFQFFYEQIHFIKIHLKPIVQCIIIF